MPISVKNNRHHSNCGEEDGESEEEGRRENLPLPPPSPSPPPPPPSSSPSPPPPAPSSSRWSLSVKPLQIHLIHVLIKLIHQKNKTNFIILFSRGLTFSNLLSFVWVEL